MLQILHEIEHTLICYLVFLPFDVPVLPPIVGRGSRGSTDTNSRGAALLECIAILRLLPVIDLKSLTFRCLQLLSGRIFSIGE
jgi:hypothetical protein